MCVCVCVAGTGEADKEGLDDQISRLAKLIGRLEDKVGVFWSFGRRFPCVLINGALEGGVYLQPPSPGRGFLQILPVLLCRVHNGAGSAPVLDSSDTVRLIEEPDGRYTTALISS